VGMPTETLRGFLMAAGPAMIGAAAGALIAMLSQLGWPPAFRTPSFDFARMSPIKNLPNTFGPSGMVRRSGAAVAKLVLVGAIVGMALRHHVVSDAFEAGRLGAFAWGLVRRTMWLVLGVLGALAAVDYYLARRRMAEQMRMSPDEVKREHREQEGDPMIRGRRKARMRELARRRIAVAVARADVVVVNPTHYAVALRYDDKTDAAPVVVAKGVDEQAEKIREIARSNSVPVLSRPPLARAMAPLPSVVFDLLIGVSLCLAALTFLVAFYVERPTEFSSFPSLLLFVTLFRLALNVASTRLILTGNDAHAAGAVIAAFGQFVIRGNFVVGAVVFLILVIVNF